MQGREHSKGMSQSETGLGRVGQGQAYGVPKMELRFEVRMENRKVMDTK